MTTPEIASKAGASGAMVVLLTLAPGQFLWLVLAELFVIWLFFRWEARLESQGNPLYRAPWPPPAAPLTDAGLEALALSFAR
jgi:hypothetical protein